MNCAVFVAATAGLLVIPGVAASAAFVFYTTGTALSSAADATSLSGSSVMHQLNAGALLSAAAASHTSKSELN